MNIKKLLILILALICSIALLASCGDGDGEGGGENSGEEGGSQNGGSGGGTQGSTGGEGGESKDEDVIDDDPSFDYLTSDLREFIELSESDYKDYELNIDIAKPHVKNDDGTGVSDAEIAILNLIASKREVVGEGTANADLTVGVGDTVNIWYRGYLLHPETGEKVVVGGMCNFTSEGAAPLGIGTGMFVAGFESNLVGTDPTQYARFEKITEGAVTAEQVIYVNYTRKIDGYSSEKGESVRIDLNENVDGIYGIGFKENVVGATIGEAKSFTTSMTENGVSCQYTDFTVSFATLCENEATNGGKAIKVVECYFPYNYGTDGLASAELRNETAYFEVYIESVVDYSVPEWNDDLVRTLIAEGKIGITEEELNEYEGDTLTGKYYAYTENLLWEEYEAEKRSLIESRMWKHYLSKATVKKYPGAMLDPVHKEYVDDVKYQFEASNGMIWNNYTSSYDTYDNIEDYALVYLGLTYSGVTDWQDYLKDLAKSLIKERLIIYYIMREEDLTPDEQELSAKVDSLKDEYLKEYISQYLEYEGKTREDYTDDEFAAFTEEREEELFGYYNDDYFEETAYYEILLESLLTYPRISTLDDRRAYPFE